MKNNLRKIDLAKNLSKNYWFFHLNYSKKIIDDLIYCIKENIKNGKVNLKNIGIFKITNKKERIGRNPKTKKNLLIKNQENQ